MKYKWRQLDFWSFGQKGNDWFLKQQKLRSNATAATNAQGLQFCQMQDGNQSEIGVDYLCVFVALQKH